MENNKKSKWGIDKSHSEIHFKVKHLVISTVTGSFDKFECIMLASKDDFTDAEIEFSADVESINTNQADRDKHLKSPDFFDAINYPKITFNSDSFNKKNGQEYILKGNLTMRGVSKKIELSVDFGGIIKDPWGNDRVGFEITGSVNRKEFGLNWNAATEAGGLVVSEDVKLQINVELAKEK